jgi:K+-dependent Na+/Ca+ exchanger-like protein
MELLFHIAILLGIFYTLAILCDEYFVPSLDLIAKKWRISSDVAGATLMAVGSSAPELFTSLFAVIRPGDTANVGAGTIVGSAIFNILVIIGASALYRGARLNWQPVVRDMLFYVASILLLLLAFWDGKIVLGEALGFVGVYIVYIVAVVHWHKILPHKDVDPIEVLEEGERNIGGLHALVRRALSYVIPNCQKNERVYWGTFTVSIVFLAGLSYLLVESAVYIATSLRINPTIVALTVLAIGTSIPDLFSSLIVARQGRGDMAVSNAVGSNIFDILFGLGFPWILILLLRGGSINVHTENLISSVLLLFATVISLMFILIVRNWWLGRRAGFVLIAAYIAYLFYMILPLLSL